MAVVKYILNVTFQHFSKDYKKYPENKCFSAMEPPDNFLLFLNEVSCFQFCISWGRVCFIGYSGISFHSKGWTWSDQYFYVDLNT